MKILIFPRQVLSPHLFQGHHNKDYTNKTMDNSVLFRQNSENEYNIIYKGKDKGWNSKD